MKKAVMCIVQTELQAETVVAQLQAAGFANNDISALFPDKTGTRDFAHEHNTKAPEGAVAGAGAGGLLGGTLGLLAGIGALAIPGLGPFIAAGPLLATLSGVAAGATVGGITGALVGMGIPEIEAKAYENKVKGGNILIAVHTSTADQVKRAEEIFKTARGSDVFSTNEVEAPSAASVRTVVDPATDRQGEERAAFPAGIATSYGEYLAVEAVVHGVGAHGRGDAKFRRAPFRDERAALDQGKRPTDRARERRGRSPEDLRTLEVTGVVDREDQVDLARRPERGRTPGRVAARRVCEGARECGGDIRRRSLADCAVERGRAARLGR